MLYLFLVELCRKLLLQIVVCCITHDVWNKEKMTRWPNIYVLEIQGFELPRLTPWVRAKNKRSCTWLYSALAAKFGRACNSLGVWTTHSHSFTSPPCPSVHDFTTCPAWLKCKHLHVIRFRASYRTLPADSSLDPPYGLPIPLPALPRLCFPLSWTKCQDRILANTAFAYAIPAAEYAHKASAIPSACFRRSATGGGLLNPQCRSCFLPAFLRTLRYGISKTTWTLAEAEKQFTYMDRFLVGGFTRRIGCL